MLTQTHFPNLFHRGKVRDTYQLGEDLLLMVATDRISAFDVVLPKGIPGKGIILAQLSAFWFEKTAHLVPNHLLGLADQDLPLPDDLRSFVRSLPEEVRPRAMVVKKARRIDVECVVRGYLAGSAWTEYRSRGTVHGHPMPKGLREGEKLSPPLFTPTTKAQAGHDQPLGLEELASMVGQDLARELEEKSLQVYSYAHDYALDKGIIIADTKFEFGFIDGCLHLIDELLTPDSSRLWDLASYAPGQSQPNFDKQFVRDWLTDSGWNKEPPAPELPQEIVERTLERYLEAFKRLTGREAPL